MSISTTAWLAFVLVGLGTWAMRASLILLFGHVSIPPLLDRSFRYVAPSVLAAISVPVFLMPQGQVGFSLPHVAGALGAGLVAWRFKTFLGTLAAGLLTFTGLSALL